MTESLAWRVLLAVTTLCVPLVMLLPGVVSAAQAQGRGGEGANVRIELRPEVEVGHRDVSLGEAAHISSSSLPLLQQLMALPLGQVPRSGDSVRLDRQAVDRWIRTRFGTSAPQIDWRGGDSARLRLATVEVSGEQLASAAQERLLQALQSHPLRANASLVRTPNAARVPGGKVEIVPRPVVLGIASATVFASARADAAPLRRQTVWVDVWSEGRFARSVPVVFELQVVGPASAGSQARASVDTGQVPTAAVAPTPPSVARGAFASLRTQQGAIELQTRVEVLQDARLGQPVRVKLPNAATSIVARVTGNGEVEIRE